MKSTPEYWERIEALRSALKEAEAVIIGGGAGLSASAGLTYSGKRFEDHFGDFIEAYHFPDMYSAGFYPFPTPEEYWAYWSRHIYYNRYDVPPGRVYTDLEELVRGRDYFVITTNVDHQFQLAGFEKERLFYTQGDYGLWQCSRACHQKTYDNEATVRRMLAEQKEMRIPRELVPFCPVCGSPMSMNLRSDATFVEDEGWHAAQRRYEAFLRRCGGSVLFLELGVGGNTPGIIKYPFWQMAAQNPRAVYACVNRGEAVCPPAIRTRSILIDEDIGTVLGQLRCPSPNGEESLSGGRKNGDCDAD